MTFAFFGVACAMPTQWLIGQENATKTQVIKALLKLQSQDIALSGSIEIEEPPEEPANPGMPVFAISQMGTAFQGPFLGEFEMIATKHGEVALVSKLDLPGVKAFSNGEEKLCIQATMDSPLDTAQLPTEISKLCDWEILAEAVQDAKEVKASTQGKITEVSVTLKPSFFPSFNDDQILQNGQARIQIRGPGMKPTVIELIAIFTLSENHEITGIQYAVQYDDPMKAMFRGAMVAGVAIPAQGFPIPPIAGGVAIAEVEAEDADDVKPVQAPVAARPAIRIQAAPAIPVQGAPPAIGARKVDSDEEAGESSSDDSGDSTEESKDANQPPLGKTVIYDFNLQSNASKKVTAFLDQAKELLRNR